MNVSIKLWNYVPLLGNKDSKQWVANFIEDPTMDQITEMEGYIEENKMDA